MGTKSSVCLEMNSKGLQGIERQRSEDGNETATENDAWEMGKCSTWTRIFNKEWRLERDWGKLRREGEHSKHEGLKVSETPQDIKSTRFHSCAKDIWNLEGTPSRCLENESRKRLKTPNTKNCCEKKKKRNANLFSKWRCLQTHTLENCDEGLKHKKSKRKWNAPFEEKRWNTFRSTRVTTIQMLTTLWKLTRVKQIDTTNDNRSNDKNSQKPSPVTGED